MKEFNYTITNSEGLHSRAIGSLVKEAKDNSWNSFISFNGKKVSLKKIFAIMSLGIKKDDVVTFISANERENVALQNFVCAHI